jgi:hypothetical protein
MPSAPLDPVPVPVTNLSVEADDAGTRIDRLLPCALTIAAEDSSSIMSSIDDRRRLCPEETTDDRRLWEARDGARSVSPSDPFLVARRLVVVEAVADAVVSPLLLLWWWVDVLLLSISGPVLLRLFSEEEDAA